MEPPDAFYQVLVGGAILRHDFTERRQYPKGIEIVKSVKYWQCDVAELEAEKPPARPEHAMRLAQRVVDVREIAQPEGNGVDVEGPIGTFTFPDRPADR